MRRAATIGKPRQPHVIEPLSLARAADFVALVDALSRETPLLARSPGERVPTVGQVAAQIEREATGDGATLLACVAGRVVGYLQLGRSPWRMRGHVAHLTIGVLAGNRGRGLGASLIRAGERWARGHGIARIELTMVAGNAAAARLYAAAGFAVEGVKRASLRIDGGLADEVAMAKLL